MIRVKVYTTKYCGYCSSAKSLLAQRGIEFQELDVTRSDDTRRWLFEVTKARTVPQIFIDEEPIGGYQELAALDRSGRLKQMLNLND